ncbi:MAG TPA: class I SAM-dependent RNA methyltransferase [Gemmatimonadaceae bacterium]
MPSPTRGTYDLFASTALGLESIAAGELKSLGVRGKQEIGGVGFSGDLQVLYKTNLWLRTASRVLVRMGSFHASTFYELERRARKLPWREFLPADGSGPGSALGSVTVRATCRKSRLYHSDAVAERLLAAIAEVAPAGIRMQQSIDSETAEDGEEKSATQLFVARIVHDQVEISADSSGDLLHRRGYRKEVAKAPLRETLAAAMVLASGWRSADTLLDPLCGSGTIPIEAALIARNIAPGLAREFQFTKWRGFDAHCWNETLAEARRAMVAGALDIRGADRDAGAIEAARRNAERAGVAADVAFSVGALSNSLSALENARTSGSWILTNPPYGVRVGDAKELRDLYSKLGAAVRDHPGCRLGLLIPDESLAAQLHLSLRSRFDSRNGGIPVSFLASEKTPGKGAPFPETGVRGREGGD